MKLLPTLIYLALGVLTLSQFASNTLAADNNLEIINVKFQPIGKGKNIVLINVKNNTPENQVLAVHIQTSSPDAGGWGAPFFTTLDGNQTKPCRFAFKIRGSIANNTWVRLRYGNPSSIEKYDYKKIFQMRKYYSKELPQQKTVFPKGEPASDNDVKSIDHVFSQFKVFLKSEDYPRAYQFLSQDYKQAEFQDSPPDDTERFVKFMTDVMWSRFIWQKEQAVLMQTQKVTQFDDKHVLTVSDGQETWQIDFAKEDGQWKIDWIAGYTPATSKQTNWKQRLLKKMKVRQAKHFDVYYYPDSTAEKEIEDIVAIKDSGYDEINRFLGGNSQVRINLILFEDGDTKLKETGHQGAGLASGNFIVEIYNEKQKLDPYHETAHVLMRPMGNPPALFNEGFATYMSERLGSAALDDLGGGDATLYERCHQLHQQGKWIELEQLFTYTEIGSISSQPKIAYAQAGSFVKFLVDHYGKDKFLKAYSSLANTDRNSQIKDNHRQLETIYGQSLQQLNDQWIKTMGL